METLKIFYSKRECRDYDAYYFYNCEEGVTISEWVEKPLDSCYYELKKRNVKKVEGNPVVVATVTQETVGYFDTFQDAFSFIKGAYS